MIHRVSLSVKIFLLAVTNVVLLAVLFFLFARSQFGFNLSSSLLAPAKATIASVSRLIALELPNTPQSSWNSLLAQYATRYPARFYLFNEHAQQLAGEPVVLPRSFADAVRSDPFAHAGNKPPRDEPPPPNHKPFFLGPPPGPPPKGEHGFFHGHGEAAPPPPPFSDDHHARPIHFPGHHAQDSVLALTRSTNPDCYWAGVRVPIWQPNRREPIHATLVWRIPSIWTVRAFFDYRPWLGIVLAIVATLIVCWVPLIHDLTQSIREMKIATGQIAEGSFQVKLPTNRRDELGQLSESINTMAQRLSGYVYGQKRFLGDIAHELSSPIARIQLGLGILEQRITGSDAAYVADVRDDVEHMSSLVSELLAFSKSQVAKDPANLESIEILPILQRVLSREAIGQVIIDESVEQSPAVMAVPDCLERALANIVRNAVRYAGTAGPIVVSSHREDDHAAIIIADQGPGLPENELENVFRPFYRPEFARQRETGGSGLGLAIVRDCIESCRGVVFCRNRLPHGLEVVIRLTIAGA